MTKPFTTVINEVPIEIYDLQDHPIPEQRGFYYNLPCDEDEKVHPAEIVLAGPHPTKEAALEAAKAFILDALKEIPSPSIVPDQS